MGVSIDTIPADVSGLIVSTLGMTFSIADNPNRALYAGVILAGGGLNAQLASATWNGVPMAELYDAVNSDTCHAWARLNNPDTGSHTLTATFTQPSTNPVLFAASLYNVDQTTPESAVTRTSGTSGTAWVSTAGAADGLALGMCFHYTSSGSITPVAGYPTFISSGTLSTATAQTTRTPTAPAGQKGDLLIAHCASENNATHTWSGSGWTKVDQQNQGSTWTVSWGYRIHDGTDVDPTVSWSGSADANARVHLFRDAKAASPYGFTAANGGSTSTHSTTGQNTTAGKSRVIYLDHANANTSMAQPSGWTENTDSGSSTGPCRTVLGGKDIASSGTASGNISVPGASAAWRQWQIELLAGVAQSQQQEADPYGDLSARASFDSEPGAAYNTFGWTASGTSQWEASALCIFPAATGVDLIVDPGAHGHLADAFGLTQVHQLGLGDDNSHGHLAETPVLVQVHQLTLVDGAHAHGADAPVLTQTHMLAAADGVHAHAADAPTLMQVHQLALQDGDHAHGAEVFALTQLHLLALADALHAHAADAVTLSAVLALADALHAHASDATTLMQVHQLALVDGAHAHGADAPSLTQAHVLALADALHAHANDAVTLQVTVNLMPTSGDHVHAADALTLTQIHILSLQDDSHAHVADSVTLEVAGTLGIQAADHVHATGNVDLTQAHVLALADALQAVTSDNIALTQAHVLALADALHGHLADALAVTQMHQLSVASGDHALATDAPFLTQAHQLALADGVHVHGADAPSLDQVHQLVAQSADHAHVAPSPVLTQVHLLVISDALFTHLADALTLTLTIPYAPSGERLLILRGEDRLIALVPESRLLTAPAAERLLTIIH